MTVTPRTFAEAIDFTESVHEFVSKRRWIVYNEWYNMHQLEFTFERYLLEKYGVAHDEEPDEEQLSLSYYVVDERKYILFKLKFSDGELAGPQGMKGPSGPIGANGPAGP